jgi:hypothetical protein
MALVVIRHSFTSVPIYATIGPRPGGVCYRIEGKRLFLSGSLYGDQIRLDAIVVEHKGRGLGSGVLEGLKAHADARPQDPAEPNRELALFRPFRLASPRAPRRPRGGLLTPAEAPAARRSLGEGRTRVGGVGCLSRPGTRRMPCPFATWARCTNAVGETVSDTTRFPGQRFGARDHTREDQSRAENRINVLLYACQAIPDFWRECRDLLGLKPDSYLRRVLVEGRQERPDFLVIEGGIPTRWIESELADRNETQLAHYKDEQLEPREVLSLVGPAVNREGDPSLEAIAALADRAAGEIRQSNPPGAEVLSFLAELIREHVRPSKLRPTLHDVPERLGMPWFERAAGPLLHLMADKTVENITSNPVSLSLQLRRGLRGTIAMSLLTQRGLGNFSFPSPVRMEHYLVVSVWQEVGTAWTALCDGVQPGWRHRMDASQRISVPPADVERHADLFAAAFRAIRDSLSPGAT